MQTAPQYWGRNGTNRAENFKRTTAAFVSDKKVVYMECISGSLISRMYAALMLLNYGHRYATSLLISVYCLLHKIDVSKTPKDTCCWLSVFNSSVYTS